MAHPAPDRNPFMLMINPEVVLAAMAKSERLAQLTRQLCRPLDRVVPSGPVDDMSPCADDGSADAENADDASGC